MTITSPSLAEKIAEVVRILEADNGVFQLFAIFQRVDAGDRWDIVVSASWLPNASLANLRLIAHSLQSHLSTEEMVNISRIAIVQSNDKDVREIREEFGFRALGELPITFYNRTYFGKDIRRGTILAAIPWPGTRG